MDFGSVGGSSSDGSGRRVIPDAGVVVGENGFPIQGRRPWDPVTPSKTEQPVGRDARPQWVQPGGVPRNGSLQDIAPQKEASRRAVSSSSGGSSLWLDSGIYMAPMQHCPNEGGASGAQAPVSGPSTNMQGLRIASSEQNKQSQMRLLALMDPASNALWFHPVQQQYASAPILLPTNQNLSWSNGTKITSYRLPCDLNSPANTIADPDSNGSIIFQMAPVTPDRGGRIQNGQSAANQEKHENSLPPRPLLHCKDPIQVSGDQDHSQLFDSLAPIYFTPVQENHGLSQPFYSSPTAVPMLVKAKGLSRQSDSSPAVHSTQVKAIRRPSQQPFNSSASLTSTSANGNQGLSQPPNSLPSISFNTLVKGNQGVSTSANGNQGLSQPPDSLPSISFNTPVKGNQGVSTTANGNQGLSQPPYSLPSISSNTLVKENQGVSQPLGSPSAILSTPVMESQSLSHHVDSSPAFDSTLVKEKGNLRKGDKEIDLNKTPPQKLPRRKKHRPKVIKERKSKKTPKPNTPKQTANKDNPSGKRKYVRKTGPKVASTPPSADNGETINLDTTAGKKPCRRALNFESEILAENKHTSIRNVQHDRPNSSIVNGSPDGEACSIPNFNFGAESQIRDGCAGFSSSTGYKSTLQLGKGLEVVVENSSLGIAFDLNHSLTQMLDEYISLPENPSPPLARKEPQQENTDVIPGKQNEVERVGGCINGGQSVNIPIHLHASEVNHSPSNQYFHSEAPIQIRNPVETYHQDHKSNTLSRLQNGIQSVNESQHHSDIRAPVKAVESNHMKTGFKRVYNQMANDTQLSKKSDVRTHAYQKIIHEKYSDSSCNHGMYGIPNIYERTNMSCNEPISGASHPTTMPIDGINGAKSAIGCDMNGVIASPVAVQNSDKWPSPSNFMEVKRNAKNRSNNTEFRIESQTMTEQRYHMVQNSSGGAIMSLDGQMGINHNQQQVPDSMSVHGPIERRIKKKWNGSFQIRTLPLLNVAPQHYQLQTIPRTAKSSDNRQAHNILHGTLTCAEALAGNQAKVKTKRRTKKARAPPSNPLLCSRTNQAHLQAQGTAPYDYRQLPAGTRESMQAIIPYNNVIDEITYRLQCLNINWDSKISTAQAQNALVPYIGERMMIPYDGQLPLPKKRRPRAKVELDDETNRVWKLLMWKEGSDGSERTDAENGKLWEEQRRIFQGRADSFIARMRLVQGDRRFSPWKGSVVDSVVGVFLTQNVSDHLSSSAFMALAARFPLRSRSKNDTANGEGRSTSTEASVYTSEIDDTIKWHGKISAQQACDQRSVHRAEPMDEKEVANCNESFGSNVGGGTNNLKGESNISYITGPVMFHESPENRTDTPGAVTESASFVVTGPEMCQESPENRRYTQVAVTERACFVDADCKVQDDVVSSQASVVSSQNSTDSTLQAADRVGSSSESNSEAENQLTEFTCNQFSLPTSFMELLGMAELFPCLSSMGNGNILYKENYEGASGQLEGTEYDITRSGFDEKDLPSTVGVHQQEQHPMERNESITGIGNVDHIANFLQEAGEARSQSHITNSPGSGDTVEVLSHSQNSRMHQNHSHLPNYLGDNLDVAECSSFANKEKPIKSKVAESNSKDDGYSSKIASAIATNTPKAKRRRSEPEKKQDFDWDSLRKQACCNGQKKERTSNRMDSVDWEAVRLAEVGEIAHTIRERGMNNMLAERIKDFLNRVVEDHGSIDLEWLRDIPPEKAKEYLLSVRGLGLKSVECVRLLTLHHLAFPVDTNVGRICVRLGWVPIEPLPESVQLHLLELYPLLENIQRYLWPRLCTLDQRTLYELHYQMITFGKVFCTKSKPNCNACPMRAECRHFASAFASARLALPGPEEKSLVSATVPITSEGNPKVIVSPLPLPPLEENPHLQVGSGNKTIEPIIEEPATPEPEHKEVTEADIEDAFWEEDPEEIPTIKLNIEELSMNVQNFIQEHNMDLEDFDMSKALVALTPEAASIPMPKLKNVSRLRTEHQVYELPDSHPLLKELDKREPDDPCSYLLAIWTPGETAQSTEPPEICCATQPGKLCDKETCFSCNSLREANAQTVRGTLLIPCRTAMRGSFPLNGTYFQVNEVFADHESSIQPMDVPRSWLWNLPRRTVYFGTSIPTIFKGLSTEGIQHCFWRGFVCVRGFDQKTRAPRPLMARLHFPASKIVRNKKTPTKSE